LKSPALKRLLARLKQVRAINHITQEHFAEKAGFSYKYYQAIETGRKPDLRLSTLERLAKACGLELHELFAPHVAVAKLKRRKFRNAISRGPSRRRKH
jgi:transcriptional regulator with XRE-family HTH domain